MDPARPHLLMTADAVGGIWTYALDLSRGLRARGMTVTVAVLGPGLDAERRADAEAAGIAMVDLGHRPEWLAETPREVAQAGEALAALAKQSGADLLQLNHPALAAATAFAVPVLAVCHSCVATWWVSVRGTPLPGEFQWQADAVQAGYRAAARLVAPTRAFAEATASRYGLPATPAVVPNGRAPRPASAEPPSPARAALTLGRLWDEGKGVATLDEAAALTRVPIRAVGPLVGPNGARFDPVWLETPGPLPEAAVRSLLAARPIFVSAARYEPFGLAALEAAQAGCALVLSDIASLREIWDGAALFVAPGDAAGFANALDRIDAEPRLRAGLGEAAQRRSLEYGLAVQVERMAALYNVLLGADVAGSDAA